VIDKEEYEKDAKSEEMKNNVLRDLIAEMDELERNYNESIRKRGKLQDQVDVLSNETFRLGNVEVYLEEVLSDLKEMRKERDALRVLLRRIGTEVEDKRKVYVWDKGNGRHKGIAIAIASSKREAYNAIKDKVGGVIGLPMFWYFMGTKPDKVFKIEDFGMLISWEEPK
jgi:ribosomal protein S3AE